MQPPVPLWLEAPLTALIRWGTEAAIFSLFSFLIGNQASGWCSSSGCQGIVDTGTSLLVMPAQYLNELLQTIGAQEGEYGQVSLGRPSCVCVCVCVCMLCVCLSVCLSMYSLCVYMHALWLCVCVGGVG